MRLQRAGQDDMTGVMTGRHDRCHHSTLHVAELDWGARLPMTTTFKDLRVGMGQMVLLQTCTYHSIHGARVSVHVVLTGKPV